MLTAVLVFGLLIAVMSLFGLASPKSLLDVARQVSSSRAGMAFAVIIRVILGCVFLLAAPLTAFPNVFYVLGGIALIAAAVLLFLGQARITGLMEWFAALPTSMLRVWLLFGLAFGGFLIYASTAA